MFYLATPYSHPRREVRLDRYTKACRVASRLMRKGIPVYCAISHTHGPETWGAVPPGGWLAYQRWFLERCEGLIVAKLPGWQDSAGIKQEVAWAEELGLPITYVEG